MTAVSYSDAVPDDLDSVQQFLQPFMDKEYLLPRTVEQLSVLMKHGFVAKLDGKIVGFAALEVYSHKLAELQCLAVDPSMRRQGVGRALVAQVIQRAASENVKELLAISASDEMFKACGFDYSLPNQKRALFIQPQQAMEKLDETDAS